MRVRFLANTMSKYAGSDGNGGNVEMIIGDRTELPEATAKALMRHYPRDFIQDEEIKDHAPKENKMAKKTAKFKSK